MNESSNVKEDEKKLKEKPMGAKLKRKKRKLFNNHLCLDLRGFQGCLWFDGCFLLLLALGKTNGSQVEKEEEKAPQVKTEVVVACMRLGTFGSAKEAGL